MVQFRQVSESAKQRLRSKSRGYADREPYRQAILSISGSNPIEVVPDSSDTLRKVKLNVSRAAKEVTTNIKYGETVDGTLLVWVDSGESSGRRKPGPKPRARQ
ncbi:MAG: hypothetical protein U0821_07210 [Chloroflexota bacterium]